jgi:hypothetical protein
VAVTLSGRSAAAGGLQVVRASSAQCLAAVAQACEGLGPAFRAPAAAAGGKLAYAGQTVFARIVRHACPVRFCFARVVWLEKRVSHAGYA